MTGARARQVLPQLPVWWALSQVCPVSLGHLERSRPSERGMALRVGVEGTLVVAPVG